MKKAFGMLAVLVLTVAFGQGRFTAAEKVVSFQNQGQKVMGTLTLPEGATAPYPMVLVLHGFTGSRQELPVNNTKETMFSRTARMLAEQGYASLRIDFRGSGESEGAWADTTFSSQISDARAGLDYIAGLKEADPKRIAILGLSQGGLVGSATAAADKRVKTMVLWSPVANPPQTYSDLLGKDLVAKAITAPTQTVTAKLPWGAETTLKGTFYQELFKVNPVAEIARYPKPLLVVVGLKDTIVAPQPQSGQIYLNYHNGLERLVELDADHVFDILGSGPGPLDQAIAASLEWLKMTL